MAQLYWPLDPSRITEGFGWADWRNGVHDGIDFGVAQGTELRATASGTVRNNDAGPSGGAGVDITTDDGWKVRHWHVSEFLVPNGSYVNAGDVIARSGGAPGTWGAGFSTGAHLHWGVKTNAGWVDPSGLNPQTFDNIPQPAQKEEETDMTFVVEMKATGQFYLWNTATKAFQPIPAADQLEVLKRGFKTWTFNDWSQFEVMRGWYENTLADKVMVDTAVVKQAVKDALAGIDINVDAIAQAVADKLDCGGNGNAQPDVTTKAEILSSIEANYPEDV